MKSSLKTFLAGKNSFGCWGNKAGLKNSESVKDPDTCGRVDHNSNGVVWYIDLLDDGTAVSYCPNP